MLSFHVLFIDCLLTVSHVRVPRNITNVGSNENGTNWEILKHFG